MERTGVLVDMLGACVFTLAVMLSIIFARPATTTASAAIVCMAFIALAFVFSLIHTGLTASGHNAAPALMAILACVTLAAAFGAAAVVAVAI